MSQYPEQIFRMSTSSTLRNWREQGGKMRLEGAKCKDCGAIYFPRRTVCAKCHSRHMEPYQCPETGVIEELLYRPANTVMMGMGEDLPQLSVIIRLDDGLHVVANLCDCPNPFKIVPGAKVRMVLRKSRRESSSNWVYAYKFELDED